jgi:AraC-like DNA-binding protein
VESIACIVRWWQAASFLQRNQPPHDPGAANHFEATSAISCRPPDRLTLRIPCSLDAQALEELHFDQPTPSEAAREAICLRACHIIELSGPKLAPDQIARELGLSTRSVIRIFAAHNQTAMRRIFDERIRQAAKPLSAQEGAYRSITQMSFACGFNDASHFGRAFAAEMDMTPSRWRRRCSEDLGCVAPRM